MTQSRMGPSSEEKFSQISLSSKGVTSVFAVPEAVVSRRLFRTTVPRTVLPTLCTCCSRSSRTSDTSHMEAKEAQQGGGGENGST